MKKINNTFYFGIHRGLDYIFASRDKDEDRIEALQRWMIDLIESSDDHDNWFEESDSNSKTVDNE